MTISKMEDMSSYPREELSEACRLLRRDPNYSLVTYYDAQENSDDDPLGSPEITVKINDDWTISSENYLNVADRYDIEDTDEDEDELDALGADYYIDSFSYDVASSSKEGFNFSEDDEQIVPSSPPEDCHLTLGKESSCSSVNDEVIDTNEVEGSDKDEGGEEKNENEGAEGDCEKKDDEKGEEREEIEDEGEDTFDKEVTNRTQDVEEIRNRSNPQPP